MPTPIRIVLVDDHPSLRSGLQALLEREAGRTGWAAEVVGEAGTGEEGLELVRRLGPTVVVTDLTLPSMSGVELAQAIQAEDLPTRVLVLSAYEDAAYLENLRRAGVSGFLTKEKPASVIAEAVFAVSRGETRWFVSPPQNALAGLTHREVEVLRSLAGGLSNTGVGKQLAISERTVRNHLTSIYEKLELASSREAVAWAWKHGLGPK